MVCRHTADVTSQRSEELWQEKFLLSSCELCASPVPRRLDSVSEHVFAGRMSCGQNKVLGRKEESARWSGKAENLFFWSNFSEQLKLQNEAVNAKVAWRLPWGSSSHCASQCQITTALCSFRWGGSPFLCQSFLLYEKRERERQEREGAGISWKT